MQGQQSHCESDVLSKARRGHTRISVHILCDETVRGVWTKRNNEWVKHRFVKKTEMKGPCRSSWHIYCFFVGQRERLCDELPNRCNIFTGGNREPISGQVFKPHGLEY